MLTCGSSISLGAAISGQPTLRWVGLTKAPLWTAGRKTGPKLGTGTRDQEDPGPTDICPCPRPHLPVPTSAHAHIYQCPLCDNLPQLPPRENLSPHHNYPHTSPRKGSRKRPWNSQYMSPMTCWWLPIHLQCGRKTDSDLATRDFEITRGVPHSTSLLAEGPLISRLGLQGAWETGGAIPAGAWPSQQGPGKDSSSCPALL